MVYEKLRHYFRSLLRQNGLEEAEITVIARPLSPEEAIGTPRDDDYPLLKGKERLMEAVFRGARGHAYTDLYGNFQGSLGEVSSLELASNFKRAVFVASLNAVMRKFSLVEGTIHCRDEEPVECARELIPFLQKLGQFQKAALIGLQPRLLEALRENYRVRVIDLDPDNINCRKKGVLVEPPENVDEVINWAGLLLVTGTAVVNGTIEKFIGLDKRIVFYGVTISGPAKVLGLKRFCPRGH
jgi:hypothetical protein